MDNKRILIVGGAGYIGGYMTDYFLKNNYNVTVFDSLLYETRFLKHVNFINGDIRNREELLKIANAHSRVEPPVSFDIIVMVADRLSKFTQVDIENALSLLPLLKWNLFSF